MYKFITSPADIDTYQPSMVCRRNARVLSSRWIKDMEGVFQTSPYPIKAKVRFSLDLLHHAARNCWELISQSIMLTEFDAMYWEEFMTRFSAEGAPIIKVQPLARD